MAKIEIRQAIPVWLAGAGALWWCGGFDLPALIVFAIVASPLLVLTEPPDPVPSRRLPVSPRHFAWSLGCIAIFLSFHYHSPEESYIPIFDNLDGAFAIYTLLAELPVFDGLDASVPRFLGGVAKNSLPTQLNLYPALFRVLSPVQAWIANDVFMRVVGLAGMLLLLRRHVLPTGSDFVVAGAATSFALLPHISGACLSVAGMPLLAHAALEIRAGHRGILPWVVIGAFPFVSMLHLVGWVAIIGLAGLFGMDALRRRRIAPRPLLALLLLTAGYVVADYRLLYQTFVAASYVSQRTEFGPVPSWSLNPVQLGSSIGRHFQRGFPHAASLHFPTVLLTVGAAFVAGAVGPRSQRRRLAGVVALIAALSILFGISFHHPFQRWLLSLDLGLLGTLHLSRLTWWEPLLWYLAFALALQGLADRGLVGRTVVVALIGLQITFVFFTNNFYSPKDSVGIRVREFYSPALFAEIRDRIGRPTDSYRVVSVGMPASIATYNGFYTADGYLGNYPLEYKHRFRRLIAGELEKNAFLRRRFDQWGARCHAVVDALDRVEREPNFPGYTRSERVRRIDRLDFDRAAMSDLGIDYVLSAVEIGNPRRNGLELLGVFTAKDSPWEILVYETSASAREPAPARSTSRSRNGR